MRDKIESKIQKKISRYARQALVRINLNPGRGMFNHACFFNSVQFTHDKKGYGVVECIYIHNQNPVLHYVNVRDKTGEYLDNTLGHQAKNAECYLIKIIDPKDYDDIQEEFLRARSYLIDMFKPWYCRFIKIGDDIV